MVIEMNVYYSIKKKIKLNRFFYFVYMPCATFIVIVSLLLLCYPEVATIGVKKGIAICVSTLIPTLFPFMLFSQLAIELNIMHTGNKLVARITEFIFGLPGNALPIIFFSFIGGFPLGALLVKLAYEKKEISMTQGRRMLLFCVNPGPSFAVSTVGCALFGSEKVGYIVYFSSVLSSIIIGVLSRFIFEAEPVTWREDKSEFTDIPSAINKSINTSVKNIVNICVWVIIFSCLSELVYMLDFFKGFEDFICMITEVTNGVYRAAQSYGLPIVCAIIGFSGFCIHLQLLPVMLKLRLKYRYFLVSRIIAAAFNCIICYFITDIFPQTTVTANLSVPADTVAVSSSLPLCICLMFLCGLFIIGDGFVANKKEKNK